MKSGRCNLKRYGALFTCLATRACHIECVKSLDTPSFLNALFRFIDRRGAPSMIYSDNATNFLGAENVLRQGLRNLNQNSIFDKMAKKGIRWEHSPALAPWQNGITEKMVHLTKRILYSLICRRTLTDFSLMSFLTGVERCLNDRPLVPMRDDCRDFNALTPHSILHGSLDSSVPADNFLKTYEYRDCWRSVQRLLDMF